MDLSKTVRRDGLDTLERGQARVIQDGDPETVGISRSRIGRVRAYLTHAVAEGAIPLADVVIVRKCVRLYQERIVHLSLLDRGHHVGADGRYYLGSFTKIFLATLIMQAVERGDLMLSRPVGDYLPDFAAHGKQAVTIRHLLAHASGLPDQLSFPMGTPVPVPEVLAEIYRQELVFPPGTRGSYCTWGFVVLAEVLRIATGREVADLGREWLFNPLGMRNTAFGCEPSEIPRIVPVFDADLTLHPWLNEPWCLLMMRGDTGAYSTAEDLAIFGQTMLNGGCYGEADILSPVSVAQMVTRQFPWADTPERLAGTGEEHFVTLSKGLGWMVRGEGFFRGSDLMSPRAFFHGGYPGMRVIVDPTYDLVSVFLTSIVATKPGLAPRIGKVGHVAHTFGTLAAAAIDRL